MTTPPVVLLCTTIGTQIPKETRIQAFGIHGDPLPEGKLDLPELVERPSADEVTWAQEFIAQRRWQEAKTYRATAPHEYTVRNWERGQGANEDFERFTVYVRRFGHADFFYRARHLYWVVDELKYWTMGWSVNETVVINRARTDTPESWKRS